MSFNRKKSHSKNRDFSSSIPERQEKRRRTLSIMSGRGTGDQSLTLRANYDRWFLFAVIALITFGLLMVTSSSMVISEQNYGVAFHYIVRQVCFLGAGVFFALFSVRVKMQTWQQLAPTLFVLAMVCLFIVLIPGIGHSVNGSRRWLGFHGLGFQVSEFVKVTCILFLASYIARRLEEIQFQWWGFLKPIMVLGCVCILLLGEPDFGTAVVILTTALAMLFLAGVPWRYYVLCGLLTAFAMAVLAISSPYRLARLTTFLDPWARQFDSGYQLTQSLIAFGRGGWFGVGLGDSIQKLFYLPEAHTDFLFAVIAEEFGLLGCVIVIALYAVLIARILAMARCAQKVNKLFSAYVAYGCAFWIAFQAMINLGVNTGVLPTKGLTLPFMSYGGSSLLILCFMVGILLRIDHDNRLQLAKS